MCIVITKHVFLIQEGPVLARNNHLISCQIFHNSYTCNTRINSSRLMCRDNIIVCHLANYCRDIQFMIFLLIYELSINEASKWWRFFSVRMPGANFREKKFEEQITTIRKYWFVLIIKLDSQIHWKIKE